MVHKLALAVGGLAAAGLLATALAFAGFVPHDAAAKSGNTVDQPAATAQTKTVTDKVYVAPVPKPQVIHVTKPAPQAAARPLPPRVVVRHTHGGEPGDGGDGGGD